MKSLPTASFYFKTSVGRFGFARWIQRPKYFALEYFTPDGERLAGSRRLRPLIGYDQRVLRSLRILKRRPSRSRLRRSPW